jgi:hypothetical protein
MKTQNTHPARSSTYTPLPVQAGVPLRAWVALRFAAGAVLAVVGVLVLIYDSSRWVGLVLLAGAAVSFWLGALALVGARSSSPRI